MKPVTKIAFTIATFLLLECLTGGLFADQAIQQIQNMERRAHIYERANRYEQAAELYIEICHLDPQNRSAYEGAKRNLLLIKQYDQLESLIQFLQQRKPHLHYKVDLASLEFQRGSPDRARELWTTVLRDHQNRQEAYLLVGRAMAENHLFDEALDVYKKGRDALDNSNLYMFNMASIYKVQNNYEQLTVEYINHLKDNPQQINYLRSDLERSANLPNEQEAVIKVLEKKLDQKENRWVMHLWCADFYTMRREYKKAFSHLKEFEPLALKTENKKYLNRYEPGYEMYVLGETVLKDHKPEMAIDIFQYIIDHVNSPLVTQAKIQLAQAYSRMGQYKQSVEMLKSYAKDKAGSEQAVMAMMNLGNLSLYELFDIEQAMEAFKFVVQYAEHSEHVNTARYKLGECAIAAADLKLAESYFKSVHSDRYEAINLKSIYKLAELAFFNAQIKKLENYIQEILAAELNRDQSLINDVLELKMLLQKSANDTLSLGVLGTASLLFQQRQYKACADTLEHFLRNVPGTPLRDDMLLLSAKSCIQLDRESRAIQHLVAVYENERGLYQDRALLRIAEIYESMDDQKRAIEYYEKIMLEFPDSIYLDKVRNRLRELEVPS